MTQPITAFFERPANARGALLEIGRRLGFHRPGLRVLVRSAKSPASELPLEETDARHAMLSGALFGALGGIMAASLALITARAWVEFPTSTLVFSFIAGTVLGVFAGALMGPTNPKLPFDRLKELAADGGLLITVEADREALSTKAERILRKHAGFLTPPLAKLGA